MKAKTHFVGLIIFQMLISCNNYPSEIGANFFNDGSLNVTYIDTLTLKVSTVKYDSIITNDATRLLIGYHEDKDLGKLSASAFFQVTPNGELTLDKDYTVYKNTTLNLTFDKYAYYDTTAEITFNVHRLVEAIELNQGHLFNTSSFAYESESLGKITFIPRPHRSDSLEIPISDELGKEIFTFAQKSAKEVSTTNEFLKYFKGIVVIADTSKSGAVLGFSTNAALKVYYDDRSQTPSVERSLTISAGENLKFNQIKSNRKGTALNSLPKQRFALDSKLSSDKAYIQSGSGLSTRVEIPYLRDILTDNTNLIISDAVLDIVPVRESNDDNTFFPPTLAMSYVNSLNEILVSSSIQPKLIEDVYLGRDTHYEVNVKDFLLQQLSKEELNKNAILFTNRNFATSVDRLYIGNQKSEYKMNLKIYCLTVKDN